MTGLLQQALPYNSTGQAQSTWFTCTRHMPAPQETSSLCCLTSKQKPAALRHRVEHAAGGCRQPQQAA